MYDELHLHASGLNVVRGVSALRQFNEVDLDIVPAVGQFERQCADERTNLGGKRQIAGAKTPPHMPVVQYLHAVNTYACNREFQ